MALRWYRAILAMSSSWWAIGAGIDDGGWISTYYLVAEIIVIPLLRLAGAHLLGASAAYPPHQCGAVPDLLGGLRAGGKSGADDRAARTSKVRGGVLIPLAFTIIITLLPKAKQAVGLAPVCLVGDVRAGDGTDHRRLPDRKLRLAVYLLREYRPGVVMVTLLWVSLTRRR